MAHIERRMIRRRDGGGRCGLPAATTRKAVFALRQALEAAIADGRSRRGRGSRVSELSPGSSPRSVRFWRAALDRLVAAIEVARDDGAASPSSAVKDLRRKLC